MFQEKVYELCQIMIQKEEIPSEFRKATLHMIYKGKGKREDLSKNRFIHSKSWFPRLVEGLVVEGALKKPLVEKSSIFSNRGATKSSTLYTCPKNMTGSFQNGRTSSKMWGPAFNIVSLPKIACKIVRPFKPDFRERWQVSEFSVSSRKTRSDQGNSRSRLEA